MTGRTLRLLWCCHPQQEAPQAVLGSLHYGPPKRGREDRYVLVGSFYRPGSPSPLGRSRSHVLTRLQGRLGTGFACVQEQKLETPGLWHVLSPPFILINLMNSHDFKYAANCQVYLPNPVSQAPSPRISLEYLLGTAPPLILVHKLSH